jgi:preprotein translocase subunit SecA
MFGKLFGSKPAATQQEDQIWVTSAARRKGLQSVVEQRLAQGRTVVLVSLTNNMFDVWADAFAAREPTHCRDMFGRSALNTHLARPGMLMLALASALPTDVTPATTPVDVLVHERHADRASDDAIVRFADQLGEMASIEFHMSLDDAVLAPFVGSVKPLLEKLGMTENEAMSHRMITNAIANCQSKLK